MGKLCLCNCFVWLLVDEYIIEYLLVFSFFDFGGRVLNNDYFLYWGFIMKILEDGSVFLIYVIE